MDTIILLVLPGALFLSILRIRTNSFWEAVVLAVGLSISLIMLFGLAVNILLPAIGVINPFAKIPLLNSFSMFFLALFAISYYQHKQNFFKKINTFARRLRRWGKRKVEGVEIVLGLMLFIFPILSVLGAISLNNGGSNVFTMVLLGGIGLSIITLMIFREKVSEGMYPTALFFIGLSLLLMTSLRSWYLAGHDVQFEYYIFQLTKQNQFWNINSYKDAYNAMLSITILPTIFSSFLSLNDMYIYKVIFQVIFALTPVVVYLFLKKYTTPYLAFIASFYFIAFPTFLNDMPMLNRQEVALLFFALLLYVLFRKTRIHGKRVVLFLFSFGMVASHYSTAYLAVFLISLVYFGYFVIRMRWGQQIVHKYTKRYLLFKKVNRMEKKQHISLAIVALLVTLALVWNGLLTKTSNDLVDTFTEVVANVGNIFKGENKSVDISYSLFFSYEISDEEFLDNYLDTAIEYSKEESVLDFYDPSTFESYRPEIVQNKVLPPTKLGSTLTNVGVDIFQFNFISRQFFAKFIQVLIIIGLIGLLYFRAKSKYDVEYVIASFASVFLIALMIILPGGIFKLRTA